MFASSPPMPRASAPISAVVARSGLAFALAVAGTVFLALTVAATIAVPLAIRQGIALSPAELATAERLGSIWWLFAGGVIVSFGASLATLGKLLQRLGDSFAS